METLAWPNVAFWILAFSASLFYGWKATDIFNVFPFKPSWAWTLHQRWLNFSGSFVGWIALWFLGQKVNHALAKYVSMRLA